MYTIKQAAARSGVTIPLLRAWERRYGVVQPARTAAGYRLYDDAALDRLRTMRRLVDQGWSPSTAAAEVLSGRVIEVTTAGATDRAGSAVSMETEHVKRFIDAAGRLDAAEIERVLDAMFAAGTFETVADTHLMPVLVELGDAWASGRIDVAAEHAASHAVQRRLAAAFQAAGNAAGADGGVIVGLPPGARHELGALAFSVAARRAGLPILYLGPDLPVVDWVATARRTRPRAAVIGALTTADGRAAASVADALHEADPDLVIAIGGHGAIAAVESATGWRGRGPIALPDGLQRAVSTLTDALR